MTTYRYYKLIESEEHYLYASEVAESWKLLSVASMETIIHGTYHNYFVIALLKETEEELGKAPIYYYTKSGKMNRVYDHETIQQCAMKIARDAEFANGVYAIKVGKKTYKFTIKRHLNEAVQALFPEYFNEDGTPIDLKDKEAQKRRKKELIKQKRNEAK